MGRKSNYSKELKIEICKRYLDGNGSFLGLASEIGANGMTIKTWVSKYNNYGTEAFEESSHNSSYTREFKQVVVQSYLNDEGSLNDLCIRYSIPSRSTVLKWIKDYNSHIELKDYIPGEKEIYMTKSRKVTVEERLEIVKYCIEHGLNYSETAVIYKTTYANVFNWVKKYRATGEDGLTDRRGRHKNDDEIDETELLKRKIKKLEHQLEMKDLEVRVLKKLDEIERRRYKERANLKHSMKQSKKSRKKK